MAAPKGNAFSKRRAMTPLDRFKSFCRFEPETGCVVWTGGVTMGRGHYSPYPAFWFEGKRWFGHRWSAKHIHGLEIDGFDVDHFCPHCPRPNTLCVEHVQALTPTTHRELTTKRTMIHLQVGVVRFEDVYGPQPEPLGDDFDLPFYEPPAWLGASNVQRPRDRPHGLPADDCPF